MEKEIKTVRLREIAATFFMIGATGFGGGMAIVALIERRCVHDKGWLGQNEFMHGLAFGQILGPFSLNTSTFVGYYLRGTPGGLVAAASFIAPSFLMVSALSLLYFRFHELPELKSALLGSNPVVIALIVVAGIGMARRKAARLEAATVAVIAFAASTLFGTSALTVLVIAGCWGLWKGWRTGRLG
ncbi:MAG: chromate transporter [Geobacteraceae bacterium GWC2_58_44]|nr:MAG: chromate transporter [Geobacteraceae bacterium GWC2_58_44]HBG05124.1 chromate transporter [Geobacter sp.]